MQVKIHLRCLFGGNVKFAAVSYKVGKDNVCVNNVNVNKWWVQLDWTDAGQILPASACQRSSVYMP